MIQIYHALDGVVEKLDQIIPGCWVKVIDPTPEDIAFLEEHQVNRDYLKYALDEEEVSRIEKSEQQTLIIVDAPLMAATPQPFAQSTIPISFIILDNYFISVSLYDHSLFREFASLPHLSTAYQSRSILQFLGKTALQYIYSLKQIDKVSNVIEERIMKSISTKEIKELMLLQKSLVYLTTSLRAVEVTLDRIKLGKVIQIHEDDLDLMDDVLIEFRQAREMADIHERILGNTMDNYGSIIANNLNDIMKILTVITLLFSVPMIVFGFYGMNVQGLWFPQSPYFALIVSGVLCLVLAVLFIKKKML